MKPEEQRIAIAEACGWEWVENHCFRNESFMGSKTYGDGWKNPKTKTISNDPEDLPDYLNDFNAMHEAEAHLTEEQHYAYASALARVCHDNEHNNRTWYHLATAAQRAEAFLRTLNLWKDDDN